MQKIVSFLKKKKGDTTNWSNFDREDSENDRIKVIPKKGSTLETQYNSTNYHQIQGNGSNNNSYNNKSIGGSGGSSVANQNQNQNKNNGEGSRGMVHSPSNSSISSSGSTTSNSTNNKVKNNSSHKKNKNQTQSPNQNDGADSDDFIPGEVRSISKILDFSKSERKWLSSLNIPQELLDQNIHVLLNVLNFLSRKEGILYIQAQNNHSIISNNSSSITPSTSSSNLYQNQQQQQIHQQQIQQQQIQQQQQQQQQQTLNTINEDNQNCTYNQQPTSNQSTPILTIQPSQQLVNNPHNSSKSNLNNLLNSSSGGTISVVQDGAIPPQPMRRSDYNRIFIEPGKYYAFPEAESYALARVVIEEEDPSKLFRTGENPEIKGAFGTVYQVFYVNGQYNNIDVALKKMDHKSEKRRRNNLNEISILKYLKHPNIATYINSYEKNDEEIWMVMEYMDGGTIKEAVSNFSFNEKYVAYITKEILHSLEYLHSINIAHRDLKSSNIMINSKAEVKLIDFGFAIDLTHLKQDIMMCGSPYYMSPEQIQDKPHGLAVDIWSLGIVVAEMVRGFVPHRKSKIKAMFLAGTVGIKFSKEKRSACHWSTELFDFLDCCLQIDPSKRLTPTQLLQHPFIATAATKQETLDLLPLLFMSKTLSKLSRNNY
ncbi:hypothetical protein DICPUDRAFT_96000 [Dictyostelium purpureum]|uniref:Protein kinase domain-containing protein n=1 Tax=Dictyostelium purpureum TaxID=5786 RepID=F1A3N2_DICPU|nr:uncharacterized protein DICPUDRAFT_96000 [Dictyostelium purpureum]EGC29193.1 hypothetical protein DICPUDRAFT_96000 [Dictyostelium purpureum]|eukprot:XP_003294276.1 hypothetical protein DICPUDRAFT_96000 [Dictyostelium purpureum]